MKHIGFIMDGNRRWAKKLSNIASFGHEKGGDALERVLGYCVEAKIPYVSFWALSKENILERSEDEVGVIFDILRRKIPSLKNKLLEQRIALEIVGDLWLLPSDIREMLIDLVDTTAGGDTMTCVLAIAYSGQDEIIRAIKRFHAEGGDILSLDDKGFREYLDTGKYPPPDIIVRTGGYIRHSGYFLYQSAYSEYYFSETLWPDFDKSDFDLAISSFAHMQRNFGK